MSKKLTKWFHRRRKAFLALAGTLATWAITAWPDDVDVQRYGGLLLVLVTGTVVHAVPNAKQDPTGGE